MLLNDRDLANFIFGFLLSLMFIGQAWVNIIKNEVSKFSVDALIIFLAQKLGSREVQKRFSSFPRNKAEIVILGIFALLTGIKVMQNTVQYLLK